jgi:hypothetical protein
MLFPVSLHPAIRRVGLTALAIGVCSFLPSTAQAQSDCSTSWIVTGDYIISAWDNNYSGSHCRYFGGNLDYLYIDVQANTSGSGYDAGAGKNVSSGVRCDSQDIGKGCMATISNSMGGSGYWTAGPKCLISNTQNYTSMNGIYECYIVENSDLNPSTLANNVVYWNSTGAYRGEGTFDGSVYKHYTIKTGQINQIWSIRQNYRNGGWTSVGYIQRDWRNKGLVGNLYNLGWKYNLEAFGINSGWVQFDHFNMPYN